MSDNVYIFPGRFQPFHNGHLSVIKKSLSCTTGSFFVGIIVHVPPLNEAVTDFEREARVQNSPERNPFSPTQRIIMVSDSLHLTFPEASERLYPILLPRPEANWPLIEAMFPVHRIWVVPEEGEAFDKMKAQFFTSKGDEVLRIRGKATTNGRVLRAAIREGINTWRNDVPRNIASHIDKIIRGRSTNA